MRAHLLVASLLVVALLTAGLLTLFWPGGEEQLAPAGTTAGQPPAGATRKIKAMLFYVSASGDRLVPTEREVPFAEGTLAQAHMIIEAQIAPAPSGTLSAIPAGTTLRALYVTERGDAFVDLSREVSAAHPGGSLNEILTVYSIVEALTTNLPAIRAVQILVDGHEVDTLRGHVDLRRPLSKDNEWVEAARAAHTSPATDAARSTGG
jgi:hypothetical protein